MELQNKPKPNSDYSAKLYQAKTANVQQRYAKQLLDLAGIKEGDRVLDIGCGCGNLVGIIASIVGPTGHVTGIDPNLERIKAAKHKYGSHSNVTFVICKSITFPIKYHYDVIISNAVLHWIPTEEKKQTFERIMRALKIGGLFVGNISFSRSHNLKLAATLLTEEDQKKIDGFYYRENYSKLYKMLENSGLRIMEYKHRYTEVNMGTVDNFLEWVNVTYYGKFDFKARYKLSKVTEDDFQKFENGDIKHTSEGAVFVLQRPPVIC